MFLAKGSPITSHSVTVSVFHGTWFAWQRPQAPHLQFVKQTEFVISLMPQDGDHPNNLTMTSSSSPFEQLFSQAELDKL